MKIFSWLLTFLLALLSIINIGNGRTIRVPLGADGPGQGGPVKEKIEHDFIRKKPIEKPPAAAKPKWDRKIDSFKIGK